MATFTYYYQNYENWHYHSETAEQLQEISELHVRQPDISNLQSIQRKLITKLESILKADIECYQLEFTGSAYEGMQIGTDVEFDVMVVIDGSGIYARQSNVPGYYHLLTESSLFWSTDTGEEDDEIVPDKVIGKFFRSLKKAVRILLAEGYEYTVKLQEQASNLHIDVFKDNDNLLFSFHIIPSFKCDDAIFLAKSPKDEQLDSDRWHLWRYSTSIQEKDFLKRFDASSNCRKKVFMIAKAMLNCDVLPGFRSYHLKTALMHLCQQLSGNCNWQEADLSLRFMDLLSVLERTTKVRNMPHLFIGSMNLYKSIEQGVIKHMYNRVRNIRQCHHSFNNVYWNCVECAKQQHLEGQSGH